jgi:hypothetical protein
MSDNPFSIQMTTVGLMLWNPTNETLDMQYAGISMSMKPGDREIFAIKCATHLLNAFGPRGLTSLVFGANEDKVGKEAVQRNIDFKTKMVVDYNQRNENRKAMQLGYLPPTEHIKTYARELKLTLLEPYAIRDEERVGISEAKKENESLKAELAELRGMLKQLMEAKKQPEPEKSETEKSELRVRKDGAWRKE